MNTLSVIIARKENKEKILLFSLVFLQVLERGFFKNTISTGRNDRLKLGKLLDLIGNNKKRQFSISLL